MFLYTPMKYALYLSILLALGCPPPAHSQTASTHHIKKEKVRISSWNGVAYDFNKAEFNGIVDSHPEFFYELGRPIEKTGAVQGVK
jgi:hypothetical protein